MTYLLLAWSQGNCAAKSRLGKGTCPYDLGPMRDAWLKGHQAGREVLLADRRLHGAAETRARRRLAA